MQWVKVNRRQEIDLWLSFVVVAVVATVYTALSYSPAVQLFVNQWADLSMAQSLATVLFLSIAGLLWVAYLKWRVVTIDREDLECVVESLNHDVLMVVNPERKVIACNEAMANVFGYTPEEVLGGTTERLYGDRRSKPGHGNEIREQIDRFGYHVGFATGKKKDGGTMPLEIFTGKLRGRRGTVLLLCDITARVEAEEQLRAAKVAAEEANAEKSELLAKLQENYQRLSEAEASRDSLVHMIVHDMKLPLQVIKGYMDLIKKQKARGIEKISDVYIDESLDQVDLLVHMVHSLLDINRLEANEMPLNLERCDVHCAAQFAIDSLGNRQNDVEILLNDASKGMEVTCDREIVGRVFANLLGNAVKYSPPGGKVVVEIAQADEYVQVSVRDEGPGIPEEYHAHVFEKFGQVKGAGHRRKCSTGLGLTFCKLAVEAHGGSIGVESRPGEGCTFWTRLPVLVPMSKIPVENAA